ncbi:ABC transporter permease [Streptomyces sp. SID13031]|uniref:ABC transporter permease n=1 Tax=Streptomyces sp. SID13031 TaxID=2706046 RepID=UPI0013C67D1E|nr:ABC transporter permease [Streptomyces sp. SID13031]NEA31232.1 ABC transporter permease [Streptomyces sp. SID13031]
MISFIVRRLLQMVLTAWLVSIITFALFWSSPVRPAREICNYNCNTARFAEINRTYGFDKPLIVQYGTYMSGLVNPHGRQLGSEGSKEQCDWPCFDRSIHTGIQVWGSITDAFWPTFWLAAGGAVLWVTSGVLLGVTAALRRGQWVDKAAVGLALIGASLPTLVIGNLLYLTFVVKLQLLPNPDAANFELSAAGPGAWLKSYLLPWITLAMVYAALYTRMTRAHMIDVMNEDFIVTARAKGLSERRVVYRHGLRAVLAPIITVFGLDLGNLLGGAIITEQIFSIYGMGRLTIDAVLGIDLPTIMAVVLVVTVFVVLANAIVDIAYAFIDPRVRPS